MGLRARSAVLALMVLVAVSVFARQAFLNPAPRKLQAPIAASQPLLAPGGAVLLAGVPLPAYAGGMFDFGLTLPFVAITFLTMMATLNALWYAPVGDEIEDRNAKLLETLSQATDMLTKADAIQVEYTENIRKAREKASAAVAEYRQTTEAAIKREIASAAAERQSKTAAVKEKLEAEVKAKTDAAEPEIVKRKDAFVKETFATLSLYAAEPEIVKRKDAFVKKSLATKLSLWSKRLIQRGPS